MYNIGIFCTEQSLGRIMHIDAQMRSMCNVTYLPYVSSEHLISLYRQNSDHFDACLFGGSYPYEIITRRFDMQGKLCAYFNISAADYYALFARLAIQQPGIDFRRVYMDTPQILLSLDSIFSSDKFPMMGNADIDWSSIDPYDWYEPLRRYYLSIWNSGKVDILITRFGSMEDFFRENHIRFCFLMPSPESMLEVFNGVLARLNASVSHDSTACMCVVDSPLPLTPEQYAELRSQLENCNKQFGMPFLLYEHGGHFELTTSISVLKEISHQYTCCAVTEFLQKSLHFPICVGWGCASTLVESHRSAHRALKEALLCKRTAAFIITEDNTLIGPLSSAHCLRCADTPANAFTQMGAKLGIAPLYLSKILSIIRQRGNDTFSAAELAFYLNVSTRSANRLLNQLEELGIASVQFRRQKNQRGRPVKIYKIYPQNLL